MNKSLLLQPSSLAGFGVLAAGALQTLSQGIPSTTGGWLAFVAQCLLGVAAVVKDDGSSNVASH